jgi:HEAT repeat protein
LAALDNCHRVVAPQVAWAIWRITGSCEELVPRIVRWLEDPDDFARLWFVQLLGQFGTHAQAAIGVLTDLLQDRESNVRSAAAEALRKIDPGAT